MVDWRSYLESICQRYAQWWTVYTFTDVVGRERVQAETQKPEIPFLDLGLMAQTIVRESEREEPSADGERVGDRRNGAGENPPKGKMERFSVLEGLRKYAADHMLLVGRPGSGKSTSLLRLLIEEAQAILELADRGTSGPGNGKVSFIDLTECLPIPVLVELRYFRDSTEDGIEALIRNFLKQHGALVPGAEIESLLFEGKLLLLMDGINELPSEEARRQLRVFHQTYGQTPMVFTTRELGVGGNLGIEQKLEMQPLSEVQMRQFVQGYLPGEGEKLLKQLQERLRSFGQTPLLLWMLCSLFRATGEVPQNLGLVFRQFTQSYETQLRSDVPVSEESRRWWPELLKTLAFRMTTGESLTEIQVAIERSAAESCLAEFLESRGCDRPWDRAKEYMQDLLEHHLVQIAAENQVEFRHQLIQEYYAAEYLLQLAPQLTDQHLKRDYLNYLKWTEPICLMLAFCDVSTNPVSSAQIVHLAIDVDLLLGAKLAGAAPLAVQEQIINFIETLEFPDWFKYELLGKVSPTKVLERLMELAQNEQFTIRKQAAYILERLNSREAIAILVNLSKHSESYIQRTANESLERVKQTTPWFLESVANELETQPTEDVSAIPELLDALKDSDYDVRRRAAGALVKLGDASAIPGLLDALKGSDSDIRRRAAEALGELGDASAIPGLLDALKDSDSDVRRSAAEVLGKLGDVSAIPGLLDALKDGDSDVRRRAAEALGELRDVSAIPGLLDALKDHNDAHVCWRAAEALGKLRDASAISGLLDALKNNDYFVRWSAANVLGQLGDAAAIPGLLDALKDNDYYVRRSAAEV